MSVIISAVVCTHNRSDHLGAAIQSLADQHMPQEQCEIIVVDNRSTDSTKEVVDQFHAQKNVRYIYEPRLGLSHARNTGWRNAKGQYVAYLDDDAIADPEWLATIVKTFESVRPSPGCIGGKVVPVWEAPRPPWVSDELVTCLTVIDWSDTPHAISNLSEKWLVGANIAFRVDILQQMGGFVSGLDRAGKNLLSGGDVFLEKQILKAGHTIYYQPKMVISHFTPKTRLNQRWFVRRYYWQGLSDAAMQIIEETPSIIGRVRLTIPKFFSLLNPPGKILNLMLPRSDPRLFTEKCFAIITVGHIAGLLGAVRNVN